jgi:hypothetical protein
MAIALRLRWTRCPDGYEVAERAPPTPAAAALARRARATIGGSVIEDTVSFVRPRSSQQRVVEIDRADLSDPLALKFIRAKTIEDQLTFFGENGLPWANPEVALTDIGRLQGNLLAWLAIDSKRLTPHFTDMTRVNLGLVVEKKSAPILVMQANTLDNFMRAEVALLLSGSTTILTCEGCGHFFVPKKRSDARSCSTRCRSIVHRRKGGATHVRS